ncbi:MAG: hypothetical protein GY765_08830, partial [bacterium]|nr:hypothetical protein [bacterium]
FSQDVLDYMDTNYETELVIVTADIEKVSGFQNVPNVKLLKKPFKSESIAQLLATT